VEGGKEGGYFFLILFFIVEWLGKGMGLIFFSKFIMGGGVGG
jgi:hypothetical protein